MAYTYTLTMDVGSGPWENGMYFYNQCGEIPLSFTEVFPDINALAQFVGFGVSQFYGGGTYSYSINGTVITWTWTWTEDPTSTECGAIAAANASEFVTIWSPFVPIEGDVCPTCQDVTINNCSSITLQAAIPNGIYRVEIKDHQSGIIYTQNIEFIGNQGTLNQTNTAGIFTPFSVYTVTILDGSGNPISYLDGSNTYNCMRITFATFTETTPEG